MYQMTHHRRSRHADVPLASWFSCLSGLYSGLYICELLQTEETCKQWEVVSKSVCRVCYKQMYFKAERTKYFYFNTFYEYLRITWVLECCGNSADEFPFLSYNAIGHTLRSSQQKNQSQRTGPPTVAKMAAPDKDNDSSPSEHLWPSHARGIPLFHWYHRLLSLFNLFIHFLLLLVHIKRIQLVNHWTFIVKQSQKLNRSEFVIIYLMDYG